jgi:hypothetical protein
MTAILIALLAAIRSNVRTRADLEAEIFACRVYKSDHAAKTYS